jgi:hypothetical protein
MRMLVCAWCGRTFAQPNAYGPVPKYCRKAHRQRAYEERVALRRIAEAKGEGP